jgi:hypothetical protein
MRFINIVKAVNGNYYSDLGKTEICNDESTPLDIIKVKVIPHEGFHKNIEYTITIKFQEDGKWPYIFIDSELYDKIKTSQYLHNKGKVGIHKGICIKNLGYGYTFSKNFKELCGNKWENYIYYLITVFNNLQDFEKGNGFKSNYKTILNI